MILEQTSYLWKYSTLHVVKQVQYLGGEWTVRGVSTCKYGVEVCVGLKEPLSTAKNDALRNCQLVLLYDKWLAKRFIWETRSSWQFSTNEGKVEQEVEFRTTAKKVALEYV